MQKWPRFGAVVASALIFGQSALAEPQAAPSDSLDQTMCAIIETAAVANNLPIGFFTRLIWRESALRARCRSHARQQSQKIPLLFRSQLEAERQTALPQG